MARSGLAWLGIECHSETECILCDIKIKWRPGLAVDDEHHKLSPNCPWLARRDIGKDMELHRNWRMPRTLGMKYHENGKIDIVCIKCDVKFPYIEMSNGVLLGSNDYKKIHSEHSPHCQ